MIEQEEWREGLPEPDYDRIVHKVKNIIVHHSATSNDLTDYTNVVRNIYLSHTQINGWSDIGYNYLISQDGTIYKGRDPDIFEQDNVMGAHFCSSNTGTMGICILGNYMDIRPTRQSLDALIDLLTWKAARDSLNPFGINEHPLNPDLHVIAGHRDGCSTLCPGDSLYEKIGYTIQETSGKLKGCGYDYFSSAANTGTSPRIKIFQNPSGIIITVSTEDDNIKKICLTDMQGRIISTFTRFESDFNKYYFNTDVLVPGIYFFIIITDETIITEKININFN